MGEVCCVMFLCVYVLEFMVGLWLVVTCWVLNWLVVLLFSGLVFSYYEVVVFVWVVVVGVFVFVCLCLRLKLSFRG